MKTAKEILKRHHGKYNDHIQKKYYQNDILQAMEEYANQKVDKAIELAIDRTIDSIMLKQILRVSDITKQVKDKLKTE